ncbi:MAG: 2-amino-4-hydroxy-6-hydroxymethyldihydropteridine diphosphokinase [Pseudomonadota bacterium]
MELAGLGLGANLGDRAGQINRALELIAELDGIDLLATACLYESPPWGDLDQPPFLNTAGLIQTTLSPQNLLNGVKEVEQVVGRIASRRWGPRHIDIDILFYGALELDEDRLTLPHKALFDRAFVLVPLAEIAPDLIIQKKRVRDVAIAHPDTGSLKRLG